MISIAAAASTLALAWSAPGASAADTVDRLFKPWAAAETPGCAVAAAHEGRTVISRAYGAADLDHGIRNTPATVFEAGSVSKQFTAAAILLLVEDGRLGLADDVRKHLPELPDYGEVITIDDLLRHTSGLRDWRYVAGVAGDRPGERAQSNADGLAIAVRQRALNHPTGAKYAYTNTGYTLLAIIVERVSGLSLAAFSDERLFRPLGMTSTRWRDDFRRIVKGRARAYARVGERYAEDMPFESAYGAGGLLTTVGDLLTWNAALDTARLGRRVTARLQEPGRLKDGRPIPYARGLFVERRNGALEVAHAGVTGGYRSWVARYPEHRVSIAILCNGDARPEAFGREIAGRFLPDGPAAPPASVETGVTGAPPVRAPAERWRPVAGQLDEFTGRYVSDEAAATYVASVEQGRLVLRLEVRPAPALVLSPTYQDTFVFSEGRVRFSRTGEQIDSLVMDVERAAGLRFRRAS